MADKQPTHDRHAPVKPLNEGYVRKGGINPIPTNFERPPPPPAFKPAPPPAPAHQVPQPAKPRD
jgi:hypothetical protein